MASNEIFRANRVLGHRAVLLLLGLCAPLGACATVSVYQPSASTEISLTAAQSELHDEAGDYCDALRRRGLAVGEASFGQLASLLTGQSTDEKAYWRRIGAERASPAIVVGRIRGDLTRSAAGLADLDMMARKLLDSTVPATEDVAQFERALIHARQARESLSDAVARLNQRGGAEIQIAAELGPLDAALESARQTADDLASARAAIEVGASLPRSAG